MIDSFNKSVFEKNFIKEFIKEMNVLRVNYLEFTDECFS